MSAEHPSTVVSRTSRRIAIVSATLAAVLVVTVAVVAAHADSTLDLVLAVGAALVVLCAGEFAIRRRLVPPMVRWLEATDRELERFSRAVAQASDMMFIAIRDESTQAVPVIIFANQAMERELGYGPGELIGHRPGIAYGPLTDKAVVAQIWNDLNTNLEAGGEFLAYRKDGTSFWSEWRGRLVVDESGGRPYWLAIGRNTDERRKNGDALAMLSAAVDAASDGVFVYALEAGSARPVLQYVNPAGIRQSGLDPTNPAAGSRTGTETNRNDFDDIIAAMRRGEPVRRRMRLYRNDGVPYWAELDVQPLPGRTANVSQWISVERDVSADVEREERLEASRAALEHSEALRRDLMAMIAHDIRGPLTSVLGYGELLAEGLVAPEDLGDAYSAIANAGKRLESLADELSLFSRIDQAEYRPTEEPIDVSELVTTVASYLPEGSRVDIASAGDCTIRTDRIALRHIVENLVSNALKYAPGESRVAVGVDRAGTTLQLTVADRGIGIPPADLPHIFEQRTRASNAGAIRGTGLGLSFVKRLVGACGGEIAATSTVGEGSTFTVRLPAVRP